jgi:hypothetical protein
MVIEDTLQAWAECKVEIETGYSYILNPFPGLRRSQVFFSADGIGSGSYVWPDDETSTVYGL